jgi:hypothetical protein
MTELKISQNKKKIEITLKNRVLFALLPTSWSDMTSDEIAHVLSICYAPFPKKETDISAIFAFQNLQILKSLTRWTDEDLDEWGSEYVVDFMTEFPHEDQDMAVAAWMMEMKSLFEVFTDFMFTENKEKGIRTINNTLLNNPLPWIMYRDNHGIIKKLYAGYCDKENPFRDATLSEVTQIFTDFQNYADTDDILPLMRLFALFYRGAKPRTTRQNDDEDDPRTPLENSEKNIQKRARLIESQTPVAIRRVIVLHMASAMEAFKAQYEEVFSGSSQNTEGGDWVDFILEVTDYDPLKKDAVLRLSAHDMMETACRLIRKSKKDTV